MNMQYHGKISIGGQIVPAIFDTGSFELVVASKRCKQCKGAIYNTEGSKTFHSSKPLVAVQHVYGSGPVNSELGYDDVSVGTLTSQGQAFYQIVKHDIDVLDFASFDAIVGIAPEGHNLTEKTLLENLHVSEYSLCLEPSDGAPGWLTWGGELTAQQKASSAAVLPVLGRHHWAVSLQSLMPAMTLTKEQVEHAQTLFCGRGCAAILDSGTSLIAAPSYALRGLEILLPKLHANCSNFASLPDIEFVLGGHKVALPPEAYAVRLRGTSAEMEKAGNLLHFKSERSGATGGRSGDECMYGFMEINRHSDFGPVWIFGMPFFRLFHTTFSSAPRPEDRRIFLMEAADDCSPQPPNIEKVPGAAKADPGYQGAMGVFPKMSVFNAVGPQQRQERMRRGPMTMEARDLRLPKSLEAFDSL